MRSQSRSLHSAGCAPPSVSHNPRKSHRYLRNVVSTQSSLLKHIYLNFNDGRKGFWKCFHGAQVLDRNSSQQQSSKHFMQNYKIHTVFSRIYTACMFEEFQTASACSSITLQALHTPCCIHTGWSHVIWLIRPLITELSDWIWLYIRCYVRHIHFCS